MSPPLMRAVKARLAQMQAKRPGDVIIDAPPGVSCPAINAVSDSEVILLVTEPTPFGFYDLKLARQAFEPLGKPLGAVVNRAGLDFKALYDYCRATGLPILAEIPYDRQVAEAYSQGQVVAQVSAWHKELFLDLAERLRGLAQPGPEVGYA
ncbi:MAG: hypothetical protein JRJ59_06445 [Deltaproteobacteria bacterium]|nr:hypothetical protein [Deltaproteobacteria bacterium]